MKKYFKKKTETDSFDKIEFGCYDENCITDKGDILCKNVMEFYYDNFIKTCRVTYVTDFYEVDDITIISEKEYGDAINDGENIMTITEIMFRHYFNK